MKVKQLLSRHLDWESWPSVDVLALSELDKYRYVRIHDAIVDVCLGSTPRTIAKKYGISKGLMSYYLSRCLNLHDDGKIVGFRSLIGYSNRLGYTRVKPTDAQGSGAGLSGAFSKLIIDYPDVKKWLIGRLRGKKSASLGIKLSTLHQDFLTELRKSGCQISSYPFTTSRLAYESFCTYVKKLVTSGESDISENFFGLAASQGKGRHESSAILRSIVSLERAAYDEYSLPDIATIVVTVDLECTEIPLRRVYLCLIVDFCSIAILGYSLSIGRGFNSSDISKAFEFFVVPEESEECAIFQQLEVLPDEGFPTKVISFVKGRRISNLCLDNHLSHLANSIIVDLRDRTGISVTYGPTRSWINRYVVEGVFSELQEELRQLPSSTGSGPGDALVDNPVNKAVKYRIHIDALCALVSKLCRRHNAQRRRSLMALTPNEKISLDWSDASRFSILPKFSGGFVKSPEIAVERIWVTVRGAQSKGRVPYVQLDEVQYTNDILRQNWSMVGKKMCVHVCGDYRTVKAFRADGEFFGVLSVSGVWALTPHDRATRKEINRLYREGVFRDRTSDPVRHYQNYLASNILRKTSKKSPPKILTDANKLVRSLNVDGMSNVSAEFKKLTESTKEKNLVKTHHRREFFSGKSS